jgi:SSS family solute:Na+ symporter
MSLSLTLTDTIVCMLVILASIGFGLYLAVHKGANQNSASFFLAGRSLTWPIVGASLFATNIGAEHLVGLSGDTYRYGLCAGTVELTTFLCLGIAASVLFPYYIRNKIFTIPEFLEMRYNRAARSFFSGLMLVICIMTKMAFHLYAGGLVLHGLLGWSVMSVVALVGAVVAVITIIGGFTVVAYTDSLQSAIMIAGCGLMMLVGLVRVGGWHRLVVAAAPGTMSIAKPFDDPNYPFWGVVAAALVSGLFYWGMDQVNVQRVLGARDLRQAPTVLGVIAAYLISATPDGLYKYLQTISLYLVMPITPAILFGIMSKRVTVKGALASVLVGMVLAALFVADQLMGPAAGAAHFPWLHTTLTLNYTYRGLLGAILVSITLFVVSLFTEKVPAERLERLTINWRTPIERFTGLTDWRLQLALLSVVTIGVYIWLW